MEAILGIIACAALFALYGMVRPRGCTGHCAGCVGDCRRHTDGDHHGV